MASPFEKHTALDQKEVILEELMRGMRAAAQLGSRLRGDAETEASIAEVIGSISRALSALSPTTGDSPSPHDEVRGGIPIIKKGASNLQFEDRPKSVSKRRFSPHPWKQVTSSTPNDEFKWKKYGQKPIKGSLFPRSYYYCNHKIDQGCKAIKYVQQKSDDGAPLFAITYYGKHTCKPFLYQNLTPPSLKEQSLISFGSCAFKVSQGDPPPMFSSAPSEPLPNDPPPPPNFETYEGFILDAQFMAGSAAADYGDFINMETYEGSSSRIKPTFSSLSRLMEDDALFQNHGEELINFDEMRK